MADMRLDPKIRQRVDASDIIQDVMIEANRRLQGYLEDPAMPFHLWLRQIATDPQGCPFRYPTKISPNGGLYWSGITGWSLKNQEPR